ncbi:phage replication initiation protein, NGO0469 family [Tardiphaga sp.]|jgi:hypothetical protein|uniref:phage replication initiation protein, NGO0469 family n=1 Tax=Tardiphaga sp. TaxID=1926292 RepID=UPI0037DA30F0
MAKMKMSSSGGSFQDPAIGTYAALCVRVIDLGTQENEYEGKKSQRRQLMLGFELHGEAVDTNGCGYMVGDDGKIDPKKPFMVSAWLTASFHEEATLRKFMESWRGQPYSDEQISEFENEGFDWGLMLGVPCMVQMAPNKNGKIKIKNLTKLHKNIDKPVMVNKPIVLMLDEFEQEAFDALPQGIRDIIGKSPEFKGMNGMAIDKAMAEVAPASNEPPFDDEIPF